MNAFSDKVTIITGAASGIGRALAEALQQHGAKLILVDRNEQGIKDVAQELGAQAEVIDVCSAESMDRLIKEAASRHGQIDYLFNNAGIAIGGECDHLTVEDWDRTIDVNLRGVVHGVVPAYRLMKEQGFGHIINTASVAGLVPVAGLSPYVAVKHAVVGLSLSLRMEGEAFGVKVSALCPGVIDTAMVKTIELRGMDREAAMEQLPTKPMSAMACADETLRGVEKNKPLIIVTSFARAIYRTHRYFPRLSHRMGQYMTQRNRRLMAQPAADERKDADSE